MLTSLPPHGAIFIFPLKTPRKHESLPSEHTHTGKTQSRLFVTLITGLTEMPYHSLHF